MVAEDIRFPSLGQSIGGHLTTGAAKGALAFVFAWLLTLVSKPDASLGHLAATLVFSYLIAEIVSAVIERPIVIQRNRTQPGGLAYVLLPFSASLLITFVATFGITKDMVPAKLITAIVAVLNAVKIILTKSWVPGPTPEKDQEMFNEFKTMSKEHFAEDVERIKNQARESTKKKYYAKKERKENTE
ncbi:hypothetical protein [Glutamicibacter arilaitensis]|uniref:hypothetical protein n=1 Tax=Glutamicibacter arilaitensis TaxID=256701 RepID=UPI00384DB8BB